ncbi:GNAT family acetyltransferase [Azospirillum sp. A39]|uniref:GNAT family acetyltransferase n=1 Tax=Azospirillum sp. A39 TaxID=3462279 RepID=UPI0040456604
MTDAPLAVRPAADGDEAAVVALWHAAGLVVPWNDPLADIALCRSKANAVLLVGTRGDRLIASAMTGHDGHRGWIYYLAVDPAHRGAGYGRRMVAEAEDWLRRSGMPKVQLMVRDTNGAVRGFYEALGYAPSPVTVMQKWLADRP